VEPPRRGPMTIATGIIPTIAAMFILQLLLAFSTLAAHLALWTWLFNRLHAAGLRRATVHRLEKVVMVSTLLVGAALLTWLIVNRGLQIPVSWNWHNVLVAAYIGACWLMFGYVVMAWANRKATSRPPACLLTNHTEHVRVANELGRTPAGDSATEWLAKIPGNQIFQIDVQHKILHVRRLPAELEGLRIAQLTDLHYTGQLTQDFFNLAVDRANQWSPDLVVVTGDIVDKRHCIDWLPSTLGRLESKFGKYFILGNHDERIREIQALRDSIEACGLENLGGRCVIRQVRHVDVRFAGNELPWFGPAPEIPATNSDEQPYSILLSHSPDQLPWARQHRFDLMLAGHTHGGQIRPPVLGPIVCPSRYGVRYASGIFDEPPTLMHVSRGLSGVQPLRLWCPPELALLELRQEP
jgi:predicted MPP superfamily phosphohydrolase